MKRLKLSFWAESKWGKRFKLFNITPRLCFTIDDQFKEGYGDIIGYREYSLFLDIFFWSFSVSLEIKNKIQ